ncbi:MAG: thioredoxin family protein [Gemmatimonadota bacterium]
MSPVALTLLASAASVVCPVRAIPADPEPISAAIVISDDLEELYRSAISFSDFFEEAENRREQWTKTYREGSIAAEMVARIRALEGNWRILAVAEDWCSDSVSTIPFLALLAEEAPNLEMRIINSEVGKGVMESHRSPDGRPATPTVLILDEDYEETGCWVERPAELQAWALDARPKLRDTEFLAKKTSWYEEDAGASTVREVVEVLEGAASGAPICRGTSSTPS